MSAATSTASSVDTFDKPKLVLLKRQKQTFCVSYHSSDTTVEYLKQQVEKALQDTCRQDTSQVVKVDDMLVYNPQEDNKVLENDSELRDFRNNQELYIVFKKSDNEWESIDVVPTVDAMGE